MRVSSPYPCLAGLVLLVGSSVLGASPADLLDLVPPESAVVLTVENLRGHRREILDSPLAAAVRRLPAVRGWMASEGYRSFEKSRGEIESALGVELPVAIDDLLGESVVLAMVSGPGGKPEDVRGLFLSRIRNRETLDRLIAAINASETQAGTLEEVVGGGDAGSPPYWHRKFRPGTKPDEWYAVLDGDVFAWTNSEPQILAVLSRAAKPAISETLERLRELRKALPQKALAYLYVDPRFLERVLDGPARGPARRDDPGEEFARRCLAALRSAGAALEWSDGVVVHLHQTFDPARVAEPLRRLASRGGGGSKLLSRVPATALVVVSGHLDASAIADSLMGQIPAADRARGDAALAIARGLFLGKQPLTEVLPAIGPGVAAFVEPAKDEAEGSFEGVAAIELDERAGIAAAVENALRTVMSLAAIDPKLTDGRGRVETRDRDGVAVTTLAGAPRPWSFGVRGGMVAFGTSPEGVSAFLSREAADLDPRIAALRRRFFPAAETFAIADLEALASEGRKRREAWARRLAEGRGADAAEVALDLDRALDLLGLFRAGFWAHSLAVDFSSAHQTFGLLARESAKKPPVDRRTH